MTKIYNHWVFLITSVQNLFSNTEGITYLQQEFKLSIMLMISNLTPCKATNHFRIPRGRAQAEPFVCYHNI